MSDSGYSNDEERITKALESASAMIRKLSSKLDVAIDALEFYAETSANHDNSVAIAALETLDAIFTVGGEQ